MTLRPAAAYLHPYPSVDIPFRIAWILDRNLPLSDLRIRTYGTDGELTQVLEAIHRAALQFQEDASGTELRRSAEQRPRLDHCTTNQAARQLGVTDRAVRLSIQRGTLPAEKNPDGSWRIDAVEIANYKERKTA